MVLPIGGAGGAVRTPPSSTRGSPQIDGGLPPKPTEDDFTPRAILRAVQWNTLTHPATLLPGAVATVAALWSVGMDLNPTSLLAMLGCGFVSAAAWVINYVGRGETFAERRVEELLALRAEHEHLEVQILGSACAAAEYEVGETGLRGLTEVYDRLTTFLMTRDATRGSTARFQALAKDTYRHGVALVQRGFNLFQALKSVDLPELEGDLQSLRKQRDQHGPSESVERSVTAHERRLERYREREEDLERLADRIRELESALEAAYLEIIDLIHDPGDATMFGQDAATRLEISIEAARRVEERLRGSNGVGTPEDDQYLDVGAKATLGPRPRSASR